jgi:hypothetical protein
MVNNKMNKLDSKSILDLRVRHALLTQIIREAQKAGDPRWKEAARQQRGVNEVLVRKLKEVRHQAGEPEPEPIKIRMQPARLKVKQLSVLERRKGNG